MDRNIYHIYQQHFRDRIISLGRAQEWPPRSPLRFDAQRFLEATQSVTVNRIPPVDLADLRGTATEAADTAKRPITMMWRWARAPSCTHHNLMKTPFTGSSENVKNRRLTIVAWAKGVTFYSDTLYVH
jgi:hypothetical protein